jgi:hypothetical protein
MERPLEHTIQEAQRIGEAAAGAGVSLKLMGGPGVFLHSPSAQQPPLKRKYGDLDFAASSRQRKELNALFTALGYEANERFNTLQGDRRLCFWDVSLPRQVDIFLDALKMSHFIDLRSRLVLEGSCASPADLLVSKMQIYELNQKDVVDAVALLLDHPVADHDEEAIDATYLARLTGENWGLYRTLEVNTERIRAALPDLDVRRDLVNEHLDELWSQIRARPKSVRWRLRAQVGDRLPWYELPEEVRSPYEPLW